MTQEQFRIMHSKIVEHYQFIELHLEEIYAVLSGKSLVEGLKDVESHSLRRIIDKIYRMKQNSPVFSEDEYKRLEKICECRNFWCHNCYVDLVFDIKTNIPKKEADRKKLCEDLDEAKEVRNLLYERKISLLPMTQF